MAKDEDLLDSNGEETEETKASEDAVEEIAEETIESTVDGPIIYEEHIWAKTNASVKVRKGPSKKDSVVGTMKKHEQVVILGEEGDWYVIYYKGDQRYVMKEFVDLD